MLVPTPTPTAFAQLTLPRACPAFLQVVVLVPTPTPTAFVQLTLSCAWLAFLQPVGELLIVVSDFYVSCSKPQVQSFLTLFLFFIFCVCFLTHSCIYAFLFLFVLYCIKIVKFA